MQGLSFKKCNNLHLRRCESYTSFCSVVNLQIELESHWLAHACNEEGSLKSRAGSLKNLNFAVSRLKINRRLRSKTCRISVSYLSRRRTTIRILLTTQQLPVIKGIYVQNPMISTTFLTVPQTPPGLWSNIFKPRGASKNCSILHCIQYQRDGGAWGCKVSVIVHRLFQLQRIQDQSRD